MFSVNSEKYFVKRAILGGIILGTLSACSHFRPDDLALSAMQIKNYQTEKEFDTPWRRIKPLGKENNSKKFISKREILKVFFTSNVDLVKFKGENDYNIYANSYFCNKKELGRIGTSLVYINGKDLFSYKEKFMTELGNPPFDYYGYIFVEGTFIRDEDPNNKNKETYNLRENPQDICMSLRSSTYFDESNSNIIVIPKERIEEVLAGKS